MTIGSRTSGLRLGCSPPPVYPLSVAARSDLTLPSRSLCRAARLGRAELTAKYSAKVEISSDLGLRGQIPAAGSAFHLAERSPPKDNWSEHAPHRRVFRGAQPCLTLTNAWERRSPPGTERSPRSAQISGLEDKSRQQAPLSTWPSGRKRRTRGLKTSHIGASSAEFNPATH